MITKKNRQQPIKQKNYLSKTGTYRMRQGKTYLLSTQTSSNFGLSWIKHNIRINCENQFEMAQEIAIDTKHN